MKIITSITLLTAIILALPFTGYAGQKTPSTRTNSEVKDLEIEKLKLEIEKLKNELNKTQSGSQSTAAPGEPPSKRPNKMSEQEFIELHRTYQDKQGTEKGKGNIDYPRSVVLRYKKFMDDSPSDKAYTYLYARLLPSDKIEPLADLMISKWPDFSYGYRIKWTLSLYNKNPPDCAGALAAIKSEQSKDPNSNELNKSINFINACLDGISDAQKVKLTYDDDAIKKFGLLDILKVEQHSNTSFTIALLKFKRDIKITKVSIDYVGMTQLNTGPGYHFKISEDNDYANIQLLLVPKEGMAIDRTLFFQATDIKAESGSKSFYIPIHEMIKLKEIRLLSLSY